MYRLKVFAGNSNVALARMIVKALGNELGKAMIMDAGDGETLVEIGENVRGMDVFIIQSTCPPVNDHLMELLVMIDAAKRASASRVTAVIPYFGYARHDHKAAPRTPITAKLVANLITKAGADRVLAIDLHADQVQGFFDIPVDNLYASAIMLNYLASNYLKETVVVAPHTGGGEMARAYAKRLKVPLAIIDKRQDDQEKPEVFNVVGEVKGLKAVIVSDMIDTAKTVTEVAAALAEKGAAGLIACVTHAVLSKQAVGKIVSSKLEKVIVTNTIPLSQEAIDSGKFEVLPVGSLLAEAIKRIYRNESVSLLFN
jgi:ribose-phosphate pyrophosphokinase